MVSGESSAIKAAQAQPSLTAVQADCLIGHAGEDLGRQSAERHIRKMPVKARPANAQPWHWVVPGSLAQPWPTALSERTVCCENPGRFKCLS
jgi:hypothetical protein